MKAFQVYEGGTDKHENQYYKLIATYLDKDKALAHSKMIAEAVQLHGDTLEYSEYDNGKCLYWEAHGWTSVTIAETREIDIIE
jgi:hypothetical protein